VGGGVAIAVWAAVAALLVVAEILTLTFVALYFAAGALAASLAAAFGGGTAVQLLVFAVVSVVSLLLTRRPLLSAMERQPVVQSNAPTVVGKRAVVIKPILEGPGQRGQVRVGTEHWSARSEAEAPIDEDVTVEVVAIDGVTLVVRPV
jgi:membrane protein implicated in regulation of membrane protease activity